MENDKDEKGRKKIEKQKGRSCLEKTLVNYILFK